MKTFNLTNKTEREELAGIATKKGKYTCLVNMGGANKRLTVKFGVVSESWSFDKGTVKSTKEVVCTINRIDTYLTKENFTRGNYTLEGLGVSKAPKSKKTRKVNRNDSWGALSGLFKNTGRL